MFTAYRSPVRLISYVSEPIAPFSQQTINRSRKKLLAEIALNNGELVIDGIEYSRNDVSALLDNMSEQDCADHCIVYTHPGLLQFLESNIFHAEALEEAFQFRYKPDFVRFISPWFAQSFNELTGKAIRKEDDFEELEKLMDYMGFLLPEHYEEGFRRIRNYLDELLYTLRNLSWEKFSADESILFFIFSSSWISFINKLPSEFNQLRDELLGQLLNVVYRFQHKATWSYLHQVCLRLQMIVSGPLWKTEVDNYEGIMRRNASAESRSPNGSRKTSPWRIGFTVIWILLLIFRFGDGCDSDTSPNFDTGSYVNMRSETQALLSKGINNSRNEINFKKFLMDLSQQQYKGNRFNIENGTVPFSNAGMLLPVANGISSLIIKNETGSDAILLYFTNNNSLLDSGSRLYAVFIKNGESNLVHFDMDETRFNFVFGKNWVQLSHPVKFNLVQIANEMGYNNLEPGISKGSWLIDYYFSLPSAEQPYLNHDIRLYANAFPFTNNSSDSNHLIFGPPQDQAGKNYDAAISLKSKNGRIEIEGSGGLYIYETPENFPSGKIETGL